MPKGRKYTKKSNSRGGVMACQRRTPQKVEASRRRNETRGSGVLMSTGVNPNFSSGKKKNRGKGRSLLAKSQELEKKMKRDATHKSLRDRPDMRKMLMGGKVKHHPGKVHGSLHSSMVSLQRNMVKDTLHKKLKSRPTAKEMVNRGHLPGNHKKVHSHVHQKQKELAFNMKKDVIHKALKNRPDRTHLHEKNILNRKHQNTDHRIVSKAVALEKQMKIDKLNMSLRNKPSLHDMHDMGLLDKNDVVGLNVRMQAGDVHHDDKKEHLENFLVNRPTKKEVIERGVHKGTVNAKAHDQIHIIGHKLEKKMKMDQLNKKLAQRPDMKQVLGSGIVDHKGNKVDRSLHAPMKALENALIKDKIHSHIRNRPDLEDLKESGVFRVDGDYISEINDEERHKPNSIPKCLDDIKRCIHNAHAFKHWLLSQDD